MTMKKKIQVSGESLRPGPGDPETAVLQESGTMYDPSAQSLDLSPDEKRRTTALLLAIQGYSHLIIKEADYLREAAALARTGDGPKLKPATIDGIVEAAIKFDVFICGGCDILFEREVPDEGSIAQAEHEDEKP